MLTKFNMQDNKLTAWTVSTEARLCTPRKQKEIEKFLSAEAGYGITTEPTPLMNTLESAEESSQAIARSAGTEALHEIWQKRKIVKDPKFNPYFRFFHSG
jgi:hypothetical protein